MSIKEKKYGLIIPAKKAAGSGAGKIAKPSVFGDSSSDEEDSGGSKRFGSSLWQENKKKAKQIESHESVVKALAEDPSVFEYDNIYDDLQEKKKRSDPRLQKKDTRPKYIYNLKRTAERRKLEQEIIYERKVQRDMEKEGKEYGDKDTFLTSAYRKKLEERKQMEEELRREEKKEAANDVTRQKDLSKFHRHLLNRLDRGTVEEEPGPVQPTESHRRLSREKDGSSYQGREKERERRNESDHERQRDRRRSREERERRRSRHRSGGSLSEEERNPTVHSIVDNEGDREKVQQPEQEEEERGQDEEEEKAEEHKQQTVNVEEEEEALAPKLPLELTQEDKEERRKAAAVKRTDSQAELSAKERYLARKRARTSAPTVVKDD